MPNISAVIKPPLRRLGVLTLCGLLAGGGAAAPKRESVAMSASDRRYLEGVYKDTWNYLARFVHPETGVPYDSSRRKNATSTTNLGLYIASVAAAGATGLIKKEDALERLDKALTSLEEWPRFTGAFPVTWVDVGTLKTSHKSFSTVDHLSNLTAGLLAVRGLYPELESRIDKILTPMEWGNLYDPERGAYRGGWRLDKNDFDVKQKGYDWYYSFLGADTRFGYIWGIARSQVPADAWLMLDRGGETKNGMTYLVPGWQGGGLFMQFICGLFLDERTTPLGRSAADFAWAQVLHAKEVAAPVWGWSASESPDGKSYIGWGKITDQVVTPHASALAAVYYPRAAAQNLRQLEKMGARRPFLDEGKKYAFGFRDAVDWKTGEVSEHYLCLDQAMAFLSLANALHNGVVWKAVAKDATLQRGLAQLPEFEFSQAIDVRLYSERDSLVR